MIHSVVRQPLGGLLVLLLVAALAGACGEESAGPQEGTEVEHLTGEEFGGEPGVLDTPAEFLGKQVTVSGDVSAILGPSSFRIAGDDFGGESLLVFSAGDRPELDDDDVVRVTGTVREISLKTFEEDFGVREPETDVGGMEGEYALSASEVVVIGSGSGG